MWLHQLTTLRISVLHQGERAPTAVPGTGPAAPRTLLQHIDGSDGGRLWTTGDGSCAEDGIRRPMVLNMALQPINTVGGA